MFWLQKNIIELVGQGRNVFFTGNAGTGKVRMHNILQVSVHHK